jgi:hypothetical protein
MDEHVLAAVVGRDETESPFSVEKLHCPARHVRSPLVRRIAILGRSEGDGQQKNSPGVSRGERERLDYRHANHVRPIPKAVTAAP